MDDIAPGLYDKIEATFEKNLAADKKAVSLLKKVESGKAKYSDAGNYADQVSSALINAFQSSLSSAVLPDGKMYWNIAEKTVQPMYISNYNLVSAVTAQVQQALNKAAGIGLKAQTAKMDADIIKNIMGLLSSADQYDDVADELYKSVDAWGRTIVDQTLKANIDFQGRAGRAPKVIRMAGLGCCSWCADLEGTYSYPNIPANVYSRHDNCRCDVEYDPGNGSRQNVWAKQWTSVEDTDTIDARKNFTGLSTAVDKEKLKTKGIKNNLHGSLPTDLQFFAEKGLSNQSSASLKKGIKSLQEEVILHEDKISNPEKYDSSWNEYSFMKQQGAIKHWEKEIKNFNESIDNRIKELKRRGDYDE